MEKPQLNEMNQAIQTGSGIRLNLSKEQEDRLLGALAASIGIPSIL